MRDPKTFDNSTPEGRTYQEHLDIYFRRFVQQVGGGSRVVRCHPNLVFMFGSIGIRPRVDEDMYPGEATVGAMRVLIENVE